MSAIRTIRGYELHEQIGAGGFGQVYRAYQPSVGREVAIKVILPQFANEADFIRRFEKEAQMVARLEHPHIVPLYDFWREPEGTYLVMRWLRGGNLYNALQRGPWTPGAAACLLDQIAGALTVAHRQGVVHRDVKPENILLDQDGNAYLSDFGIAKDVMRATMEAGATLGSLWYVSPEQAQSQPVTPQSDLYSLGVVMYEVLAGTHPFSGLTPADQLIKRMTEPLPSLRERQPDLPVALEAVIQRATAKDPAERYPDALALATAFREALAGAPDRAAPEPEISPQPRAFLEEETLMITEKPDPMLDLPIADAYMRWALDALEEVAGAKDMAVILRQAGLTHYIGNHPPNDLVFRGCSFREYAALNRAILEFYGRAAGSFARRIGRVSTRNVIEQQGDLLGLQQLALRAIGTNLRVKLALMSEARMFINLYQKEGDIKVSHSVEDHGDHFIYALKECPCCAGLTADRPICAMWVGVLYEGGIYVTDGKIFEYQEIACRALGDEFCTFKVGKVPVNV